MLMMTKVEPRPASGEPAPGRSPRRVPGGREAVGTVVLVGGALAATLYPVVVAVDGATRADGYRPAEHWVSLLSRGERGWLGTTALVVTGVLVLIAGLGVRSRWPGACARPASGCVVALGAAFITDYPSLVVLAVWGLQTGNYRAPAGMSSEEVGSMTRIGTGPDAVGDELSSSRGRQRARYCGRSVSFPVSRRCTSRRGPRASRRISGLSQLAFALLSFSAIT
jgi:hypothetical protein